MLQCSIFAGFVTGGFSVDGSIGATGMAIYGFLQTQIKYYRVTVSN